MKIYIIAWLASALTFISCELLWIGVLARNFYRTRLDQVLADSYNLTAAGLFYVMYMTGIVLFAVAPVLNIEGNQWKLVALMGGLFGFFCYATYNLTNAAVLKQWSWTVTTVDVLWGVVLTATAAVVAYHATQLFN